MGAGQILMRARIHAGLEKIRIRQLENDYRDELEAEKKKFEALLLDRKSTRLNSSHT